MRDRQQRQKRGERPRAPPGGCAAGRALRPWGGAGRSRGLCFPPFWAAAHLPRRLPGLRGPPAASQSACHPPPTRSESVMAGRVSCARPRHAGAVHAECTWPRGRTGGRRRSRLRPRDQQAAGGEGGVPPGPRLADVLALCAGSGSRARAPREGAGPPQGGPEGAGLPLLCRPHAVRLPPSLPRAVLGGGAPPVLPQAAGHLRVPAGGSPSR